MENYKRKWYEWNRVDEIRKDDYVLLHYIYNVWMEVYRLGHNMEEWNDNEWKCRERIIFKLSLASVLIFFIPFPDTENWKISMICQALISFVFLRKVITD